MVKSANLRVALGSPSNPFLLATFLLICFILSETMSTKKSFRKPTFPRFGHSSPANFMRRNLSPSLSRPSSGEQGSRLSWWPNWIDLLEFEYVVVDWNTNCKGYAEDTHNMKFITIPPLLDNLSSRKTKHPIALSTFQRQYVYEMCNLGGIWRNQKCYTIIPHIIPPFWILKIIYTACHPTGRYLWFKGVSSGWHILVSMK